MNPIVFALRHPVTVMVAVASLILGAALAFYRMPVDIFPSLDLPVIYVAQPYGGLDPAQMEGLITNYYEYHFLYISNIDHVESQNIQGNALMKLYFHPGTNMAQAMAETVSYINRSRAFMPPGTVPPFVMRFDTGSVPVGYLVLSNDANTKTIGEIQTLGLYTIRPMFSKLPGVSAPPPYGGNQRTIVVRVDPDRLRALNLSPDDVAAALASGNTVSPSGNIRVKDQMPIVPVDSMVKDPAELGAIPIRPGSPVHLRDLGTKVVEDSTDIPTGYALVNGRRAVYILVTKRADASTLTVVNAVKRNLPTMQAALPDDVRVQFEFDQSPYVTGAMWGVGTEGLIGAVLTGLMVLVFLRDWRSVLVVVLNIPFALLGSVIGLWLTGQTVNLMTLGGLALSVGILVDEATVEVENIHAQMENGSPVARAVRLGNHQTAVPRLLAMLCIVAVFIPSFFMEGAARALFTPLALAVGFSMVTSYLLSSTFVPVLSVWLLRNQRAASGRREPADASESAGSRRPLARFDRLRDAYARMLDAVLRWRWLVVALYVAAVVLIVWLPGGQVGTEIFPTVDAGQFQLRIRAPTGTRIERTEEVVLQALDAIKEKVGADKVGMSVGYVGTIPSAYPVNTVYTWMSGPEDSFLRVALKEGSGVRVAELRERLRQELPPRLQQWFQQRIEAEGVPADIAAERARGLRVSFEPADIINQVMSFGSPTPVEVTVSGKNLAETRVYVEKLRGLLEQVPSLRDVQMAQPLDYPTVSVKVDREKAGDSGATADDVARSLASATSSSRFIVPNYWADPATGIGFQVQVEIPPPKMDSAVQVGAVPVKTDRSPLSPSDGDGDGADEHQVLVRDVARVGQGTMPGEYDRYNMTRLLSITANVQGEDLGRVAQHVTDALARAGAPPKGATVEVRGQIAPMQTMFQGLELGLGLAVAVIFLLLAAYFQSPRLALAVLMTAPAVVAGVAVALLATGTTLNIQSFMGAIMAIGVATANAILLVTFAEKARREGADALTAAVEGARHRLRPILMTSCAMIAGMLPMALGLGEGGDEAAPLGLAVIGGLIAATLTTLFILPSVFAALMAWGGRRSASLDPDDPQSPHYERRDEMPEQTSPPGEVDGETAIAPRPARAE